MRRLAIVAGLLLAAAALAGVLRPEGAAAEAPAATTDTVSVSGVGAVSAVPDEAGVSAGVETRGSTAQEALNANAAAMRRVIAALREAGGKDVTTQAVTLSPRVGPEGQSDGFTASNVVSATIDLDRAGALIDAAVAAGANTVYGPTMTHSQADRLYRSALTKAVADAKVRAQVLAAAAGRELGRVSSIVEGGATPPVPYAKAEAADAGAPIVSGPQDIAATVSVTFELR
jgi:hypothetical protein